MQWINHCEKSKTKVIKCYPFPPHLAPYLPSVWGLCGNRVSGTRPQHLGSAWMWKKERFRLVLVRMRKAAARNSPIQVMIQLLSWSQGSENASNSGELGGGGGNSSVIQEPRTMAVLSPFACSFRGGSRSLHLSQQDGRGHTKACELDTSLLLHSAGRNSVTWPQVRTGNELRKAKKHMLVRRSFDFTSH